VEEFDFFNFKLDDPKEPEKESDNLIEL